VRLWGHRWTAVKKLWESQEAQSAKALKLLKSIRSWNIVRAKRARAPEGRFPWGDGNRTERKLTS
jgi:hypothetical protein